MRVNVQGETIPYPVTVLRGKLRLCGISHLDAERVISQVLGEFGRRPPTEEEVIQKVRDRLRSHHPAAVKAFDVLTKYDSVRAAQRTLPPLILVLEGASATGKSMLSIPMILNLAATRVIGTDTIRQVLRTIYSERNHQELYCHTYQAYRYRQAGPLDLSPVVRGYLAQCELMEPVVRNLVERTVEEGADAVIEGVHVRPGSLRQLSSGIIEVVVEPGKESHKAMFMTKDAAAKLKTVSSDQTVREKEFEATRLIQEYLVNEASRLGVHVLKFSDYDQAERATCSIVVDSVKRILETGGK